VIDNVVWTDSWLNIVGAGCDLISVEVGEEQARKVHASLGVVRTNRIGLRDLVADGVKCGPHGGKNSMTKSCTFPWLSLKVKIEPGRHGGQFMSGY
jgi:hypothetical protein